MSSYLDQSLAKLEQFEGAIPWMYRDTVGKVTVGVGLMLPDAAAAQGLPFQLPSGPASAADIAAEYARVDALPMGRPALFYRGLAKPELAAPEILNLLRTVLLGFEGELRAALPDYDSLPDNAKLALLDMAYNLGPHGLLQGYPRLIQAVEAGHWAEAAAESTRLGPGPARNEWTRQMFLSNVVKSMHAVAAAEGTLKNFGFGLLGMSAAILDRLRRKF